MDKTITKKKIVIFSGAGVSKESGVDTFRDSKDGLWENFKIDEVATPEGWKKDKSKVLDFYNARRRQMVSVEPNDAHKALVELEDEYDVTIVTQNVDDLHERAGSTNILHLHGELTKARTSFAMNNPLVVQSQKTYDIGYENINMGDLDEEYNSQLRPHIVWFSEYPFHVERAYQAFRNADIIVIIGTSLNIGYTIGFFGETKIDAPVIYIDPEPSHSLDHTYPELKIEYRTKAAVEGVTELVKELLTKKEE
jgi:NAD-dependent deacetylase